MPASKGILVVGPTASGKTDYSLRLAQQLDGEIVSVDSRQVYRRLQIGTAKPRGDWHEELYRVDGIAYHLVDIWEPSQPFTAADFVALARDAIAAIERRGKRPILAGGTGLYFKALLEGLAPLPPADPALRVELKAFAESEGRAALHAELARFDPEAAAKIPANNIHRLLRAVEVFRLTGKPISVWHREHQAQAQPPTQAWEIVGIDRSKSELDQRIAQRCEQMLHAGLIDETRGLLDSGIDRTAPALTGLGYPRVVAHLEGRLSQNELLPLLIQDTRQYAKRQLTWFRNQMRVDWRTI